MKIWIYPGSFDPVTMGHLDIVERAARLCDRLIVAVLENITKKAVFTADERVAMLQKATAHLNNVETARFGGLMAEFAEQRGAEAIVRGLRSVSDFEMEFQMATMNRRLAPGIETIFIMTSTEHSFVSSTIVKDVGRHGGDISGLIPEANTEFVKNALRSRRS